MSIIIRNTDNGEKSFFADESKMEILGMEIYITPPNKQNLVFSMYNHVIETENPNKGKEGVIEETGKGQL